MTRTDMAPIRSPRHRAAVLTLAYVGLCVIAVLVNVVISRIENAEDMAADAASVASDAASEASDAMSKAEQNEEDISELRYR